MKKPAVFLAVCGLAATLCGEPASAADACSIAKLSVEPSWLTSAEWFESRGQILTVDAASQKLRAFSPDGKLQALDIDPAAIGIDDARPLRLVPLDGGYLLTLGGSRAVRVTDALAPATTTSGTRAPIFKFNEHGEAANGIGSVYDVVAINSSTVLAYGSVQTAGTGDAARLGKPFQLGYFLASLDDGGLYAPRMVDPYARNEFHLLALETMGIAAGRPYYLTLAEKPEIRTVDQETGNSRLVTGMPKGYETLPTLGIESSPATSAELFAEIEKRKMVSGLFTDGVGGRLYVLTREQDAPRGGTLWLLHQLDPSTGQYTGVVRLPTVAPHITIARGRDSWFIFERQAVLAWGKQPVRSLLTIPASWIEAPPTSPLRFPALQVEACATRASR